MNNKITFPRLAAMLADKSGRSKRFSEDFLRELFSLIGEQLEAGDVVKIKGLGAFRLSKVEPRKSVDVTTGQPMEISGHSKVVFTPAKELAEAVNAPFEAFTSIELPDDVDVSNLNEDVDIDVIDNFQEIDLVTSDDMVISDDTDNKTADHSLKIQEQSSEGERPSEEKQPSEEKKSSEEQNQELPVPMIIEEPVYIEESVGDADGEWNDPQGDIVYGDDVYDKSKWKRVLMICTGCAVVAVILTFVVWSVLTRPDFVQQNPSESHSESKIVENEDFIQEASSVIEGVTVDDDSIISPENLKGYESSIDEAVPTAPSDAIVYDTIGTRRYLTTMAKDHYGNNRLWPYIYEENKTRIGHPDKIRPGTPIVIPSLDKYGVDPNNPSDIAKADKLGVEIYARYNKSI